MTPRTIFGKWGPAIVAAVLALLLVQGVALYSRGGAVIVAILLLAGALARLVILRARKR